MKNKNISFFSFSERRIPELLSSLFQNKKRSGNLKILDMGCGEGALLAACISAGYLDEADITGLDISKRLIGIAKNNLSRKISYVQADVRDTKLKPGTFDIIYSAMVIEHLDNPGEMIKEIHSLLKSSGTGFISTIIKKPWAVYFYRKNGKFVIDPTHLHEFESSNELKEMVEKYNLEVLDEMTFPRSYHLLELLIKILMRLRIISPSNRVRKILSEDSLYSEINKRVKIIIPGFYETQIMFTKK